MERAYQLLANSGITIKRARGRYLYTDTGRRILDLCLDGGRLVLGRKTGKSQLVFKNLLEQGSVSALPSVQLHRFERAVIASLVADSAVPANTVYLSEYSASAAENVSACYVTIRTYRTYRALVSAVTHYESTQMCNSDATSNDAAENDVLFRTWMPFLPSDGDYSLNAVTPPTSLYVPDPFPLAEAPFIAVFSHVGTRSEAETTFSTIMPSDQFSPAVLGGAARSFDDLHATMLDTPADSWALYDDILQKYWNRSGAWLYPRMPKSDYDDFVADCLSKNVLISPDYAIPSVVPLGAGPGELRKL